MKHDKNKAIKIRLFWSLIYPDIETMRKTQKRIEKYQKYYINEQIENQNKIKVKKKF